jgi:nitroreductase
MPPFEFDPLPRAPARTGEEMLASVCAFCETMASRRSVRHFSDRAVDREIIVAAVRAAAAAPSGANLQPWHFVLVSNPATKRRIRIAAEEEERAFYGGRAPEEWLEALAPLGTDAEKPFLEIAPWLIAVFVQKYGVLPDGRVRKHYYPVESVGIATGFLIAALHHAGLATLTHTPSPMKFLNEILGRPAHEKPFLLLVAGHPSEEARIPRLERKRFEDVASFE